MAPVFGGASGGASGTTFHTPTTEPTSFQSVLNTPNVLPNQDNVVSETPNSNYPSLKRPMSDDDLLLAQEVKKILKDDGGEQERQQRHQQHLEQAAVYLQPEIDQMYEEIEDQEREVGELEQQLEREEQAMFVETWTTAQQPPDLSLGRVTFQQLDQELHLCYLTARRIMENIIHDARGGMGRSRVANGNEVVVARLRHLLQSAFALFVAVGTAFSHFQFPGTHRDTLFPFLGADAKEPANSDLSLSARHLSAKMDEIYIFWLARHSNFQTETPRSLFLLVKELHNKLSHANDVFMNI